MRTKIKKAIPFRYHDGLSQLRPNAGGIDIGASEVWVDLGNKDAEPIRMFETFTADLNRMADWLKSCGIETVAMESTGVYWIPVCQILESKGIEVYLVNARQAKNVSGRKSDMLDCQLSSAKMKSDFDRSRSHAAIRSRVYSWWRPPSIEVTAIR